LQVGKLSGNDPFLSFIKYYYVEHCYQICRNNWTGTESVDQYVTGTKSVGQD